MESIKVTVREVYVPLGSIKVSGKREVLHLRKFQEEVVFNIAKNRIIGVEAPTGSGKTLMLLAPLLSNVVNNTSFSGVVGLYPTKALVEDQYASITTTLDSICERINVIKSADEELAVKYACELGVEWITREGETKRSVYRGTLGVVKVTREILDKISQSMKSKPSEELSKVTLLDLIRRFVLYTDYLIAIAVPEYPYFLLTGIYRNWHDAQRLISLALERDFAYELAKKIISMPENELASKLFEYRSGLSVLIDYKTRERLRLNIYSALFSEVLFLDEFHVWSFYEKPTIYALLLLYVLEYESIQSEWRIILSSATPQTSFYELIEKAGLEKVSVVRAKMVDDHDNVHKVKSRTIVEFVPVEVRCGALSWFNIEKHLPNIVKNRSEWLSKCGRFLFLGRRNSVVEECAEIFYESTHKTPTIVTGVNPPDYARDRKELADKKYAGDLYVFANYAADIGIDLRKLRCGVIHATYLGELIQRLGRIGRGDVDEAYVIVPVPRCYIDELLKLNNREVSYDELINVLSMIISETPNIAKHEDTFVWKHFIGKLRLYAPLATHFLLKVALWEYHERVRKLSERFIELVNKFDLKDLFSWLQKIQKKTEVLIPLASLRLSTSTRYERNGKGGEASLTTLLMNYEVEYDPVKKAFIIKGISKKRASEVLELKTSNLAVLKHLDGLILGSQTLLAYCSSQRAIEPSSKSSYSLYQVLSDIEVPVYLAISEDHYLMELLNAYGCAIKVKTSVINPATGEYNAVYLLLL